MKLPRFDESSYAHFITAKTVANKPLFRDEKCCRILLKDLDFYRQKLGFKLLGYVIMPDHWHCIIWWNAEKYPNLTVSKIMHDIKGLSAQNLSNYILGSRGVSASTKSQGAKALATRRRVLKIWQPSFYDFNIYSERKLREKLNYIHYNPVRAGLCKNPENWLWSSYRDYEFGGEGVIEIERVSALSAGHTLSNGTGN